MRYRLEGEMKTSITHVSNFGSFRPFGIVTGWNGYVEYHDSSRYAKASDGRLLKWLESPCSLIRNAAAIELAERGLEKWRKGNL